MINEYDIETSDLTTGVVGGTGVFDVLLKAVEASVSKEFAANRITGVNYSTVYLGGLQSVLQNATQFLLEKDRAALSTLQIQKQIEIAEAELVLRTAESESQLALQAAQKLQIENQISISNAELALRTAESQQNILESQNRISVANAELALRTAESQSQIDLQAAQKLQVEAQTALQATQKLQIENQITIANAELAIRTAESQSQIALQAAQKLQVEAQTALQGTQKLQIEAQISIANAELVLRTAESESQIALQTSQRLNLDKELELKTKELELRTEQVLVAKEELLIKKQELLIAVKELELREKALLKAESEIALLNEKVNTEKAQTSDVRVDGDAVVGVVGKQKELFEAQREGFTNDHIQKMTKLQLDIYAVNKSAIPDIPQGMFINPKGPYDDIWTITGGADVDPT